MKRLIKQILKEDRRQMYLDRIIEVMKNDYPLIKNLKYYDLYDQFSEEELNYVLSGIFGEPVKKVGNNIFNQNVKRIYSEYSNGDWYKYEYNQNGNRIYYEDSNGYWVKREYDDNGNKIYSENSNGRIIDNR